MDSPEPPRPWPDLQDLANCACNCETMPRNCATSGLASGTPTGGAVVWATACNRVTCLLQTGCLHFPDPVQLVHAFHCPSNELLALRHLDVHKWRKRCNSGTSQNCFQSIDFWSCLVCESGQSCFQPRNSHSRSFDCHLWGRWATGHNCGLLFGT